METMTLEELRSLVRQSPVAGVDVGAIEVGIDAAIRERDELRSALSEMRELARDYERDRDKAESELAALRKRIEEAPQGFGFLDPEWGCPIVRAGVADTAIGKRVRLLVEDDDARSPRPAGEVR